MRVDFYLADRSSSEQVLIKLVAKAWPAHRQLVITGPEARLSELDRLLWDEPGGRFLPHGADEPAPIRLLEKAPEESDILINLHAANEIPGGRYRRILEIIGSGKNERAAARQRFRAWQAAGAEVHHHQV